MTALIELGRPFETGAEPQIGVDFSRTIGQVARRKSSASINAAAQDH